MFSGYGVPPVRRSPRCAWGWSVAWDAGLPQDALVATQRRNGRAFSSLTARGGGLPVGVTLTQTRCPCARVRGADHDFVTLVVPGGAGFAAQFALVSVRAFDLAGPVQRRGERRGPTC